MERTRILLVFSLIFILLGCATRKVLDLDGQIAHIPEKSAAINISEEEPVPQLPKIDLNIETAPAIISQHLTYSQVTNLIGNFLDVHFVAPPSLKEEGEVVIERFRGASENKLVRLEFEGKRDDVVRAELKLFYPKDISKIDIDLNNAMLLRFLRNVAPEIKNWTEKLREMTHKFYSMPAGTLADERLKLSDKTIHVSYDKKINIIIVSLSLI